MDTKFGSLKNLEAVFNENLPHILSGTAVVGVVTTSVAAAKAWEKIKEIYASEITAEEKVKLAIKTLIPAFTSGAITIGCIVSSDMIHTQRYSTLLAAYVAAKAELPKAKELLTIEDKNSSNKRIEDKTEKVESEHRKTALSVANDTKIYNVVDLVTGYEFHSSVFLLKQAEKEVERLMFDDGGCSLETFYEEAEYDNHDRWLPNIAEDIRWHTNDREPHMNLEIEAELDDTGEVYLTISYDHN